MTETRPGFAYVWEYEVPAEHVEAFERLYGPKGEWVQLFSGAEGYCGTELHCDADTPGRYMTIDYWTSREARDRFRKSVKSEFDALDQRGDGLTSRERPIGEFIPLPASPNR